MENFTDGEMGASGAPQDEHEEISRMDDSAEWPCYREDSIFESTVVELAASLEVSDEMARTSILGAMSIACQGLVNVAFPNGHTVPVSLMTFMIAETGERKTATDDFSVKPIQEFVGKMNEEPEENKAESGRLQKNWEIKIKALEKALSKAVMEGLDHDKIEKDLLKLQSEKPKEHNWRVKLIYGNVPPIMLAYSLHKNFPYACVISNEAGNLLNGQTFKDVYIFTNTYSGSSHYFDRPKGNNIPSFTLHNPRLTVNLMLQEAAVKKFLEKKGKEAHGSGFLNRFLVVKPRELAGYRTSDKPPVSYKVEKRFYERVIELLQETVSRYENGDGFDTLLFSPSAKSLWRKQSEYIESQMRQGGIYYYSKGHATRLRENITRVAAIIHTFEGYKGDISSETLDYAIKLCMKYSQHYLNHLAEEPEVVTLTNLLVQDIHKLATRRDNSYFFKKSRIQQYANPNLRNIESRELALETLEKLGHLRIPFRYGGDYEFRDTVWTSLSPELKNGQELTISELPFWSEQEIVGPFGCGRYGPEIALKEGFKKYY